jgi:glutathione synthase/RimK-type ligase-like ATP-grasp enzyme
MKNQYQLLVLPTVQNIDEVIGTNIENIVLTKGSFKNLTFQIRDNIVELKHDNVDLKEFSNIWLSSVWQSRDLAFAVSLYLGKHSIQHSFVEQSTSKITDQLVFALADIVVPNTFYVDKIQIEQHVEIIESICGYPLIIKDIKGSKGKDSALVANRRELIEKFGQLPTNKKYFFLKFIPNEFEWGIMVVDGKVVSGEKSYPKDNEFRNHAVNGATEVFVDESEIPEEIKEIAIRSSNLLGLSWSRADILVDKFTNIPYLLEVNRFPGITSGSSEVGGAQYYMQTQLGIDMNSF